jgi:hypothetical protein
MPLTARIRLCAEPSVRVPLKLRVPFDLERILAHQPGLEREDLLFDADAGRAIPLPYPVEPGIRRDLDEGVVAARALQKHHLHVANLHALPLGCRPLVKGGQERRNQWYAAEAAEKVTPGEPAVITHATTP